MSTHKAIDKICCVVLALTLLLTILFVNGESLGLKKASSVMGYESKLFDTSKVHTINIIMDDWDTFVENCQSEEYAECTVVIDNEAYKNVAIRGKGNTSLTQVASYGNNRYSFKIEFDHYDSSNTYYGLDKLCLNNIIQDNTYMKDYLCYQMMNEMGVASPLCSYVYITVNGEDWGLYLAVEGVEESFLQRNYGKDYGSLYKPDSQSMGGGRGNGQDLEMDSDNDGNTAASGDAPVDSSDADSQTLPEKPDENNSAAGDTGAASDANTNAEAGQQTMGNPPDLPDGNSNTQSTEGVAPDGNAPDGNTQNGSAPDGNAQDGGAPDGGSPDGGSPDGQNSSDDVLLKYIDDNADSYSNIFDNAKTDVSDADKTRLIASLKNLSEGEDIEDTVDVDAVIRYFVVHNFVLNFDSYTGSMIHNYYLYEKDGQMQMIPWDYNLAFGGFESAADATSLVNYPIDTPVSGGDVTERPMLAWIFASEEYTDLYHQYFSEFLSTYFDSGKFEEMIDSVSSMIAPYVEKDPTKFCTYEEFETGVSTLKEFCLLRAESISGQLNGTIGSTSDTQDSTTLIDASSLQISDMGTMNNNAGGQGGGPGDADGSAPDGGGSGDSESNTQTGGAGSPGGDAPQGGPGGTDTSSGSGTTSGESAALTPPGGTQST